MRNQPMSLKRRVFMRLLVITTAAVLLFYAIGLYLNSVGIRNLRANLQDAIDAETRFIASQIQRDTVNLSVLAKELSADKDLLRYAITYSSLSDYQRIEKINQLSNRLLQIKRFSDLVETAEIFLPEIDRVVVTDRTIYNDMDQGQWNALISGLGQQTSVVCELGGRKYLLCAKFSKGEPMYLVSVCLSPERLLEQITEMASEESLQAVLLREDGTPFVGSKEAVALMTSLSEGKGYGNDEYFSASEDIPMLGLRLWCSSPSDMAVRPFLQHRSWVFGLTALAALLLGSYLLYYKRYILRPLDNLYDTMTRAAETGQFHIAKENADFDDMYAQFNTMMENIERLTGEAYEERLRAQQAELRQLQMQINPHFFYNTLFLIYRMAQSEGSDQIAQLSLNLSNYYRYITKLPEHDVPLREEVEHIKHYLEIQGVRFAPRVTVEIAPLPEEIAQEHIPPLILQPIVENAFVHGVKDKTAGGLVAVRYVYDEARFGVTVYDNGGSMDEESVRLLDERMRSGQLPEGSALYNLYRRMELCYGTKYELRLESVDQGLMVTILFPRTGR